MILLLFTFLSLLLLDQSNRQFGENPNLILSIVGGICQLLMTKISKISIFAVRGDFSLTLHQKGKPPICLCVLLSWSSTLTVFW